MLKVNQLIGFGARQSSGGSPPPFTPASMAGLSLWADADIGLSGVSVGNPISTWVASVGSNLTQSGVARPTKAVVDGRVAASFAGQHMALGATLPANVNFTIFCKFNTQFTTNRTCLIGSTAFDYPVAYLRTGVFRFASATRTGTIASSVTGWHDIIFVLNGTAITVYLDGSSSAVTTSATTGDSVFTSIGVGRADRLTGAIRSIGYYSRAINATEAAQLHAYLAAL